MSGISATLAICQPWSCTSAAVSAMSGAEMELAAAWSVGSVKHGQAAVSAAIAGPPAETELTATAAGAGGHDAAVAITFGEDVTNGMQIALMRMRGFMRHPRENAFD